MATTFDPADLLTPHQQRIMRYAYRGYTEAELCMVLGISPYTLLWHIRHIRKSLPTFHVSREKVARLSKREEEVALLVAEGQTNVQIASLLAIEPTSVRTHLKSVYRKIGVTTRVELALCIARRRVLLYAQEAA